MSCSDSRKREEREEAGGRGEEEEGGQKGLEWTRRDI